MAQELKSNYIQWGFESQQFPGKLQSWSKSNPKINDDDNFFISRVKPKQRFRYTDTQVVQTLQIRTTRSSCLVAMERAK